MNLSECVNFGRFLLLKLSNIYIQVIWGLDVVISFFLPNTTDILIGFSPFYPGSNHNDSMWAKSTPKRCKNW